MLRRSVRTLPLLALSLLLGVGCKQPRSQDGKQPEAESKVAKREVKLPEPLPLPADPSIASWVARPAPVIARVQPYLPMTIDVRATIGQLLGGVTSADLAQKFAAAINLDAPFGQVVLDGRAQVGRGLGDPRGRTDDDDAVTRPQLVVGPDDADAAVPLEARGRQLARDLVEQRGDVLADAHRGEPEVARRGESGKQGIAAA